MFIPATLGFYSRAEQFAQFPSSNITGILQRVTFPVLSSIQNEEERLRTNYIKFLRLSAFIVFPLMMGLAALAGPFIRIILTEKWSGIVALLQIICFAYMWYPIHAINLNLLQVKGRSDLFLKLEIIKKIVVTVMLFITVPLGITAICIGKIANSFISLTINTYYTGKIIDVGFYKQMKDLLPILINSMMMFCIIYMGQNIIDNDWIKLIVGFITGAIYYI